MSDIDLGDVLSELKRIRAQVTDLIGKVAKHAGETPAGPSVVGDLRAITERAVAESGGSLRAFAKRAGVDHAALGRFVKGEKDLNGATLDKLAAALNLELTERKSDR